MTEQERPQAETWWPNPAAKVGDTLTGRLADIWTFVGKFNDPGTESWGMLVCINDGQTLEMTHENADDFKVVYLAKAFQQKALAQWAESGPEPTVGERIVVTYAKDHKMAAWPNPAKIIAFDFPDRPADQRPSGGSKPNFAKALGKDVPQATAAPATGSREISTNWAPEGEEDAW